jgi:capsid protein
MGAGRHLELANPYERDSKVSLEDVFRGGKVADLYDGEEIRTVQDSRPHPNQMSFLDDLVRDMSWGFGVSPEVLWFVGKINGTSNRFLLADAVKWVEQKQQRLADSFCRRYWIYHIACEMKAGRLRQCEDPEWWKVGFIPQTRLTVDRSKDGKLSIDLRKAGMITLSRYYDEQFSEDWKPPTDQWMDELAYIRDGLSKRGFESLAEVQALLGATQVSLKEQPASVATDGADPDDDDPPPDSDNDQNNQN